MRQYNTAREVQIEDILGIVDGSVLTDVLSSTEKYKQMIQNCIKYGSDNDGKVTKTKLAKLVYLADFIWYYLKSSPMSGMTYRKLPRGPVSDVYFRALDEMEEDGVVVREIKANRHRASGSHLFSLEKEAQTDKLTNDEVELIKEIGRAWKNKPTDDIVNFTHEQLPWQICRDGEIIPYNLITQEEPERVYGTIQL